MAILHSSLFANNHLPILDNPDNNHHHHIKDNPDIHLKDILHNKDIHLKDILHSKDILNKQHKSFKLLSLHKDLVMYLRELTVNFAEPML